MERVYKVFHRFVGFRKSRVLLEPLKVRIPAFMGLTRVQGFGFRVSGFGFRVSGFGFGFRV